MKTLSVMLITTILLNTNIIYAGECDAVIRACDNLVESLDLTITKQQKYIGFLERRDAELTIALEKELERESVWYKNPAIIIPSSLLLGLIVGGKIL